MLNQVHAVRIARQNFFALYTPKCYTLHHMADSKQPTGPGGRKPRRGIPPVPPLPKMPRGDSFWINLATSILLLLLLASAYSYFAGEAEEPIHIPISELAADIERGAVTSIVVKGEELDIVYTDETKKTSKKEA